MADSKITALTENTGPLGSDLTAMVDDPGGSPLTQKIQIGNLPKAFFMPQGVLLNGYISRTVASNNLTVAVKTLAGSDPSASDPVLVRIGNSVRAITSALSVTKNAGTNWCNSGSVELAAQEIDYFVYLIWNTTPATDVVDIGFSRISYGRVYSDFSGTTTNEKYLAYGNASAPTSTDEVEVIGRVNATLSAAASYNWSVPGTSVVVSRPVFETRWLTWIPIWSGFSADPTVGKARYHLRNSVLSFLLVTTAGTSNATTFTGTLPFNCAAAISFPWARAADNGANLAAGGRAVTATTNVVTLRKDMAVGAWTNSGTKNVDFEHFVEI